MTGNGYYLDSWESTIKVEPEYKTSTWNQNPRLSADEIFGSNAKIFSGPMELLERQAIDTRTFETSDSNESHNETVETLVRKCKVGLTCKDPCCLCRKDFIDSGAQTEPLETSHSRTRKRSCDFYSSKRVHEIKAEIKKDISNPSPSKKQRRNSEIDDFQKVSNIAFATVMCGMIYKCLVNSCGFQTFNGASFEQHVIEHDNCDETGDDHSFCCACDSRIEANSLIAEYHHLMQSHAWEATTPEEDSIVDEPIDRPVLTDKTQQSPEHFEISVAEHSESAVVEGTADGVSYKIFINTTQNQDSCSRDDEEECNESNPCSAYSDNSWQSDEEDISFEPEKIFKTYSSALTLFFFYLWIAIECMNMKMRWKPKTCPEEALKLENIQSQPVEAAAEYISVQDAFTRSMTHSTKVPRQICQKIASRMHIEQHMDSHKVQKVQNCVEAFEIGEDLKKHILKKHFVEKLYECHCGSVYGSKSLLKSHQQCHNDDKWTCDVSQKQFSTMFDLKGVTKHWQTHFPAEEENVEAEEKRQLDFLRQIWIEDFDSPLI